jgi:uncharacterized protein (DUF1501 family)
MSRTKAHSRRRFLEIMGVGAGVVALRSVLSPAKAFADSGNPQLLLFCYLSGGWDQLLAFDPRPYNQPKYQTNAMYSGPGTTGIFPAYDWVVDPGVESVLATPATASGVQTRGNVTFGPAVPDALLDHSADLCVIRGMSMETLTHEVGRRYFTTGKFPRGLAPNGSALTTVVAAEEGSAALLPNLAISTESYNEGQAAFASPVRVNNASDVLGVLTPLGATLDPRSDAALLAFEESDGTCEHRASDGGGLVSLFKDSRKEARSMTSGTAATLFQYSIQDPVQPLFDALDIGTNADLNGPKGKAAIAALALENGISQAVSVEIASGLDDHDEWDTNHAGKLRSSFDTLGRLIGYLKARDYKGMGGGKVWDHTTLVIFSEFARTPTVNSRVGRDHHLASSCVVAGPGIQGNLVVGATSDQNMAVRKMNLATGTPDDEAGALIRPSDVHATVLQSMGLPYDHLSNQTPQIITKILK